MAAARWVTTTRLDGRAEPFPFLYPNYRYLVKSAYSGGSDLLVHVQNGSVENGTGYDVSRYQQYQSQLFTFRVKGGAPARTNAFVIANADNQCMEVAGASLRDGARVQLWPCDGLPDHLWYLQRRSDGRPEIRNWNSDKCLDAQNPASTVPPAGTYLQQWKCLGGQNQAWQLAQG